MLLMHTNMGADEYHRVIVSMLLATKHDKLLQDHVTRYTLQASCTGNAQHVICAETKQKQEQSPAAMTG